MLVHIVEFTAVERVDIKVN